MTPDERIACWLDELGAPTKRVQRPAAEALAAEARRDPALRGRIAACLRSPDARRRWGAAYALAQLEPAPLDAVPVLVEALGVDDGDLRWASARLLTSAATHRPEIRPMLAGLLGSSSWRQRKMALYCLRDLGPSDAAVTPAALERALDDPEPAVRLAALATVAVLRAGDPDAAAAVVARLEDPDVGVRRAAAAALGRLGAGTTPVRGALAHAATSPDAALARAAAAALSRLDDGPTPASR
jgi:HEAT repeat protein